MQECRLRLIFELQTTVLCGKDIGVDELADKFVFLFYSRYMFLIYIGKKLYNFNFEETSFDRSLCE